MPIEFECPACSKSLRIANRKAGFEVRCPSCKSPCVVPAENAVAGTEDIDGEAIKAHPETSDKHSRDDGVPIHHSKKSDKADSIIGMLVLIGLPIFIVVLGSTWAIMGRKSVPIAFCLMTGLPIFIFGVRTIKQHITIYNFCAGLLLLALVGALVFLAIVLANANRFTLYCILSLLVASLLFSLVASAVSAVKGCSWLHGLEITWVAMWSAIAAVGYAALACVVWILTLPAVAANETKAGGEAVCTSCKGKWGSPSNSSERCRTRNTRVGAWHMYQEQQEQQKKHKHHGHKHHGHRGF